jgi:molybdenum cofactor guanylyltransferase
MNDAPLPQVGGYVLAGGKSSRMGTDKALLDIDGKPLVAHAVAKLQRICADVHILSSSLALAEFAPLVRDLHFECGPIGGIEAALDHSRFEWNLILPVDLPFVPADFLRAWVRRVLERPGTGVAYFNVLGIPQPSLAMIRREAAPAIGAAIERGDYKLRPVLEAAASGSDLYIEAVNDTDAAAWFANLNTPEELEIAKKRAFPPKG